VYIADRSNSGEHHLIIHSAGSQQCRDAEQIQVVARNVIAEITAACKIDIDQPLEINGTDCSESTAPGRPTENIFNLICACDMCILITRPF